MADLQWHDDGNYHWCTWSTADGNSYDYHIRLAANSYNSGGSLFNMFNSLPNVNAPSGGEKVAVLNGGIFYSYGGAYYNTGPERTWYGIEQQWDNSPSGYLKMGSWGSDFDFTTGSVSSYPVALGCPANSAGSGESGVSSTRSHAFIGHGNGVNYMGYCRTASDPQQSGITGAQIVAKMTGLYGGTCAVLDGGGSTQMQYMGSTKTSGDGRSIKNAIVLYRTVKSPGPTPDEPVPPAAVNDGDKNDVAGLAYFVMNNNLKITKNCGLVHNNQLKLDPKGIYVVHSNALKALIKRFNLNYVLNGGVINEDYYRFYWYTANFGLPVPTHANYQNLPVRFWGWYKNSSFGGNNYNRIVQTATGDRTYYAKWLQYKKQYRGYYLVQGSTQQSIPEDSYSGTASPVYFSSRQTHGSSVNVTKLFANFDNCTSSWDLYIKPRVDYGYFTGGEGQAYYHNIGTLYSQGEDPSEKSVNFTVPAGSSVGFRVYQAGGGRNKLFLYSGAYYKYGGQTREYVDWQDSSSPPSGTWDSGYPEERYVQRYYNGSSWTLWST